MTILVSGATGNIGRRIVDHLIELGANDIRALTTNPAKAGLPDGVQPVTGYLGNPESLPAALQGVDRMYLAPLPKTLDVTLDLVKKAGVEYLVALSGAAHWQEHADKVNASGIVNTQLGPGEFLDNFAIWSEQIKATRTVREPYPTAVEAPISIDDIARVAATLLVKPEQAHHGQMYPITGPQALTRAQIAEQVGVGISAPVTYEKCDRTEAEQHYNAALGGQASWYLDQIAYAVEHPQYANQLVAEITGSPAQSVAQWAAANAELFL
ncbi:SDR family oxidoreductase [Mycobacterium sp. MMS18-G62]